MNIGIFCLTIFATYGIINIAYKAWKRADLKEKMKDIEEIETQYDDIKIFKKKHKGDINKKQQTVKNFTKGAE